jgi:hypothetical protein
VNKQLKRKNNMTTIRGVDIGEELCRALKLNAHEVKSITIHVPANDIVTIDVTMYATTDFVKELIETIKRFDKKQSVEEMKSILLSIANTQNKGGKCEVYNLEKDDTKEETAGFDL